MWAGIEKEEWSVDVENGVGVGGLLVGDTEHLKETN